LLAALLAVNRLDTVLLTGPAIAAAAWQRRWLGWVLPCLLGGLPLLLWFLFAFVYYGSPLPITVYAKVATGLAPSLLAAEGVRYLLDVVTRDPGMALVLAAGLLLGCVRRPGLAVTPLVAGALLYFAYTIKVGGDFMAGRFLTPPFVLLAAVAAHLLHQKPPLAIGLGTAAAALAFVPGTPPWLLPAGARPPEHPNGSIIDERAFYYEELGLRSPKQRRPQYGIVTASLRQMGIDKTVFDVSGFIGQVGFNSGPQVHLVDPWLLDPLLMRLPLRDLDRWRIGHYSRTAPDGYLETLARGRNEIPHPGLHAYYDKLQLVVRGEIWSWDRLSTAFWMQLGAYDDLVRQYVADEYRTPRLRTIDAGDLPRATPPQQWWFTTASALVGEGGLLVRFAEPPRGTTLQLGLDSRDLYRFVFLRGEQEVAASELATIDEPYRALEAYAVPVPPAAAGFDRLRIERGRRPGAPPALPDVGFSADGVWAISSLRVE
jgi:arabinofuranosyltransferase